MQSWEEDGPGLRGQCGAGMDLSVQGWEEEPDGWGLMRDERVVPVKARKVGRDLTTRTWSPVWTLL